MYEPRIKLRTAYDKNASASATLHDHRQHISNPCPVAASNAFPFKHQRSSSMLITSLPIVMVGGLVICSPFGSRRGLCEASKSADVTPERSALAESECSQLRSCSDLTLQTHSVSLLQPWLLAPTSRRLGGKRCPRLTLPVMRTGIRYDAPRARCTMGILRSPPTANRPTIPGQSRLDRIQQTPNHLIDAVRVPAVL